MSEEAIGTKAPRGVDEGSSSKNSQMLGGVQLISKGSPLKAQ